MGGGTWDSFGRRWLVISESEQIERIRFKGVSFPWLSLEEEQLSVGLFLWNYVAVLLLALPAIILYATGVAALEAFASLLFVPSAILFAWLTLSLLVTVAVVLIRVLGWLLRFGRSALPLAKAS